MNKMLKPFIGKFSMVYFDDILVFSKNIEEHLNHLCQVFTTLRSHILFLNMKKCEFHTSQLLFLGFIVSEFDVHVDITKVRAITEWPTPHNVQEVHSFHGLATFYWCFICNFSTLSAPITNCMKQERFHQSNDQQQSFELIKSKLSSTPILTHLNFDKVFEVEIDASMTGIRVVLTQEWRPIKFVSEKLNEARQRWMTYEQDLFAIIQAFHHWEHYLVQKEFILHSDHHALQFMNSQRV